MQWSGWEGINYPHLQLNLHDLMSFSCWDILVLCVYAAFSWREYPESRLCSLFLRLPLGFLLLAEATERQKAVWGVHGNEATETVGS